MATDTSLSALEIVNKYPEYAEAAARTLGISVEELRSGLTPAKRIKVHLPIIGDPNEPKNVERKLLQIQEPRTTAPEDIEIGVGSTTLDMWKYRAQLAESKVEALEYDVRHLRAQLLNLHQTAKGLMHSIEVSRDFLDRNKAG